MLRNLYNSEYNRVKFNVKNVIKELNMEPFSFENIKACKRHTCTRSTFIASLAISPKANASDSSCSFAELQSLSVQISPRNIRN